MSIVSTHGTGSRFSPAKRGAHAPNAIDNFCFDVTLSYRRLERPRRVTDDS